MNPDTNKFESVTGGSEYQKELDRQAEDLKAAVTNQAKEVLLRPDGSPVPSHWTTFTIGEHVVIKNYTFEVKYIGETAILFKPVGPLIVPDETEGG